MKIQLHKNETIEILGLLALAAIVLVVILVARQDANFSAPVSTDVAEVPAQPVQAESVAPGFSKPIDEYTPAERRQYQITETNDAVPVFAAAQPAARIVSVGPDLSAVDIRMREQYQITEEYPFHPIDFSIMDPHTRELFQITETYP